MHVDFKDLKERVKIVDVLAIKGIKLRHKIGSEYASGPCPLRVHPQDDRGNAFGIHLPTNRFQCKNTTCQKENGVGDLWGDCINLLAGIDGIRVKEAAIQLLEWFPMEDKKTARITERESGANPRASSVGASPTHISVKAQGSGNGKSGYMAETNLWLDEVLKVVPDEHRAVTKKMIANRILESYRNGRTAHS